MLNNNANFTGIELIAIFGEENVINIDENFVADGIVTDTRIVSEGNIFVAISGENFDGHNFIAEAFTKSAVAVVITKDFADEFITTFPNKSYILVNDTIIALGKLANYHRSRFNIPIVAVGGSNGKTTTKEMISAVLGTSFNTLKTYGNFNNQIGVPLMLLQLNNNFDAAVLELGTNSPGEIYNLSNIVKPTHAIITNIGKEHLEFLIDLDGVEVEETYLYSAVRTDGFAFVNYDDERLRLYGHILGKFMTYGVHENSQLRCEYILDNRLKPKLTVHFENESFEIQLKTTGYTSALNAISAIAVGIHFGIEPSKIIEILESFQPLESANSYGRMAVSENNGIIIINDTYNANPDSMMAALKNLDLMKTNGKKISILGDMRELGETSVDEHINILNYAITVSDLVFITGDFFCAASSTFDNSKISYEIDKNKIINSLLPLLNTNDCVLVKGSRGMKMEFIVNSLKGSK